jgi:large exoprotein involved in heme utilization and adhesion
VKHCRARPRLIQRTGVNTSPVPPRCTRFVFKSLWSFSDFNLIENEVASFQGPSNVQNLLARVTGGSASSIDYVKLADGGKFNARLGGNDLFTTAPVSAFGFVSPTLRADNFLSSETPITATGVTSGTVEISPPELDLASSLVILPGALVDASTQLREQCAARPGLDFSSFLVIGRGGVSLSPDEPLPASPLSQARKDAW